MKEKNVITRITVSRPKTTNKENNKKKTTNKKNNTKKPPKPKFRYVYKGGKRKISQKPGV